MEHKETKQYLDNLRARQPEQSQSLSESNTCDGKADILLKRIFSTFSIVYGGSWDKNLADDELTSITKQVWSNSLRGLTRAQIEHGLDNLKGGFAPTPDTFKTWCVGSEGGLTHNTAAYKTFDKSKAIEHKADKSKAKTEIEKMKKLLGK